MRKSIFDIFTYSFAKRYTDTHGGGSGGTSDYSQLSHKPSINGVTLEGNKSSSDLGINPIKGVYDNENLIIS